MYENITSTADFEKYKNHTANMFGAPPKFNSATDPRYIDQYHFGRTYMDTYMLNPTIVSLCPCKIRNLPNLTGEERENFVNSVKAAAGDMANMIADDHASDASGPLYETVADNIDYYYHVNYTARMMAILMGVGDKTYPGTNIPYKHFDWSTRPYGVSINESLTKAGGKGMILDTLGVALSNIKQSVFGDSSYVHFYAADNSTASEDISVSTKSSMIEGLFNSSGIDDISKEMNYLFGDRLASDQMDQDFDKIVEKAGSDTWLGQVLKGGKGYLQGARMNFPQMIDEVSYGKTMSMSSRFISPYGDRESIYLHTLAPLAHILPFAVPGQFNANMYKFPFLAKVHCSGWFNSDVAVVSNLQIRRGGPEDKSWTIDGLATEIEVTFDITPMYSNLMLSNTYHPLQAIDNTGLMEFLVATCGVGLRDNNSISLKMQSAAAMFGSLKQDTINKIPSKIAELTKIQDFVNYMKLP